MRGVEDYLQQVKRLEEGGQSCTATVLAQTLGVSLPSASEMLKRLAEEGYLERAKDGAIHLTAYGRTLAHHMSPVEGQRSFRSALHAVADALTAHGFAAHAEARGGSLAIIAEQCPFGDTAVQHPVMCAIDRGMVKGMLAGLYGDTVPETEASRPQGDDVCVTTV